jgi:hypothetical protein
MRPPPVIHQNAQFCVQPSSDFADPPCSAASFEVNSEPHTGARSSVRLCVGLIKGARAQMPVLVIYREGSILAKAQPYSPCSLVAHLHRVV